MALAAGALVLALALPAGAQTQTFGKLTGTVVDLTGVPQMGATVTLSPEGARDAVRVLTNDRGAFVAARLTPGAYTIRVTLAGFLPAMERNVRITANLTTQLKIELASIFASIDTLRRKPNREPAEADDWAWVLRTAAAQRAILRFGEGEATLAGETTRAEREARRRPAARVELTAGSRRPGSVSNIADAPSTAVAYDQKLGAAGRLTFAGQASYERAASAGFATMWVPSGEVGRGPETTLVLRQASLGDGRLPFRGARLEHNNQMTLGGRLQIGYGAEYILASVGRSTSSVRPNVQVNYLLAPEWRATLDLTSRPWGHAHGQSNALQSVLEELDAFPTILLRDGRPVLEGGWHEEFALERRVGARTTVTAGVFHDRASHTALFGRGLAPEDNFLQDAANGVFAYDGGASSSNGARLAYRQRMPDGTELLLMYVWAGAVVPGELSESTALRDALEMRQRHGVAARVSTRLPFAGTQIAASYKWLNAPAVSRQDSFGEVAYQVDPYLNFSIRQPLPNLFAGKLEALADFRNLLAQGYVPVNTADGRVLLIPAFRSVRGGLSIQF
jgi:hypothetical protein